MGGRTPKGNEKAQQNKEHRRKGGGCLNQVGAMHSATEAEDIPPLV